ncbi:hypothetical protein NKJ06_29645 [Mesorhizobium sp. M0293]|uniref:hypothetical protein n=1 Tax=Mesorhizobium sp. M0293 TaxID=2956930 RepID=UPI0033387EB5
MKTGYCQLLDDQQGFHLTSNKMGIVMNLPLVNTFLPTYEAWETRPATKEEMLANGRPDEIKVAMIASVSSATEAATHIGEYSTA